MPICEICGGSSSRRVRLEDGRLVCWECRMVFKGPPEETCERIRQIQRGLQRAWDEVDQLKSSAYYGSPYSVVPHKSHIKKALEELDKAGHYGAFYRYLSGVYRVPTPQSYTAPSEVPEGAIACYIPDKKAIVAKEKSMTHHTAYHELFHHLEHEGIVVMAGTKTERERNANLFAEACEKSE